MQHSRRRNLWTNLVLLFVANSLLFYLLDSWANKWIAILAGVGIMIMCLVGIFIPAPDGVVCIQTSGDPDDVVIPAGTQLQNPDESYVLVTTRTVRIRWYTRLWCWFRNKPLPRIFEVPVKRVDN